MKKFLALFLTTISLSAFLSVPAFAQDNLSNPKPSNERIQANPSVWIHEGSDAIYDLITWYGPHENGNYDLFLNKAVLDVWSRSNPMELIDILSTLLPDDGYSIARYIIKEKINLGTFNYDEIFKVRDHKLVAVSWVL